MNQTRTVADDKPNGQPVDRMERVPRTGDFEHLFTIAETCSILKISQRTCYRRFMLSEAFSVSLGGLPFSPSSPHLSQRGSESVTSDFAPRSIFAILAFENGFNLSPGRRRAGALCSATRTSTASSGFVFGFNVFLMRMRFAPFVKKRLFYRPIPPPLSDLTPQSSPSAGGRRSESGDRAYITQR